MKPCLCICFFLFCRLFGVIHKKTNETIQGSSSPNICLLASFQKNKFFEHFNMSKTAIILILFTHMAGILQTRTISHCNTLHIILIIIHYILLCCTYQPRLCAHELFPKEFTGGFYDDPYNPDTLAQN